MHSQHKFHQESSKTHETALGSLAWPKVTVLLILILATVVVSEWVTAKVREKLI